MTLLLAIGTVTMAYHESFGKEANGRSVNYCTLIRYHSLKSKGIVMNERNKQPLPLTSSMYTHL